MNTTQIPSEHFRISDYADAIDKCVGIYDTNGGMVRRTELTRTPRLTGVLKCFIYLKREDLQVVHSFKIRGAYNKVLSLSEGQLRKGVIAASAGNHGQGVSLACAQKGACCEIVMPVTTPSIKVQAVWTLGGKVHLVGDDFDAALEYARARAKGTSMIFIDPFNDREVIIGQGTIAKEILAQFNAIRANSSIDAVFVPVGGGGLIAGVGSYLKTFSPETRVFSVEPQDCPTMQVAIHHHRPYALDSVGSFADGVAVRQVGDETFRIAKDVVDECITVSTDEICSAIREHFLETRSIVEPAGALALAGVIKYAKEHQPLGKHFVAISSGANINFDNLKYIAERCALGDGDETLFGAIIPDRPGCFLTLARLLKDYPITEFNYRMQEGKDASVFVGLKLDLSQQANRSGILASLKKADISTTDLVNNEMAKLHIRHMVGGRVQGGVQNERVFRFCFPERKGALLQFLESLQKAGAHWNISLFHYRNHGAAYGNVLVGIQIPSQDSARFGAFVKDLAFECVEETQNTTYRMFLR